MFTTSNAALQPTHISYIYLSHSCPLLILSKPTVSFMVRHSCVRADNNDAFESHASKTMWVVYRAKRFWVALQIWSTVGAWCAFGCKQTENQAVCCCIVMIFSSLSKFSDPFPKTQAWAQWMALSMVLKELKLMELFCSITVDLHRWRNGMEGLIRGTHSCVLLGTLQHLGHMKPSATSYIHSVWVH